MDKIKVNTAKLEVASKAVTPYKMARKLLPEFFTIEERSNCTCVPPPKPGAKVKRPQVDSEKLTLLYGEQYCLMSDCLVSASTPPSCINFSPTLVAFSM